MPTSKVLYRSIYEVAVYTARATLEGRFLAPDMADVASDVVSVRWSDAIFALGLSDVSGLKEAAVLHVNGRRDMPFAPSLGIPSVNQTGIHVKLLPPATRCWPRPTSRRRRSRSSWNWRSVAPPRSMSRRSRARRA